MVTLNNFKELDPSFLVIASNEDSPLVKTLCTLDCFQDHGVVFIKNKKYYRRLLEFFKSKVPPRRIGVIFQKSFFIEINVQEEADLFQQISFYATVQSIDLSMSYFSKLFFDEFNKAANDLVDGRKTGTAHVHPTSSLAETVFLGEGVTIDANVTIHSGCVILSHSRIGENTVLYPNVVVYRNVAIGKDCRIHANTTIGSDGYGYNYSQGEHLKVWHFGGVQIEDSVEIGSNTSIDQGTFSPTMIGRGTKIDNQVHLAHNCKIGKGVLITGQAGFGGSVTLGDYVAMGGCANFAPGVNVGDYAQIGGMSGVTGDVPKKAVYGGHPARPLNEWLRTVAAVRKFSLKDRGKNSEA